jgi:hypothetical protein
VALSRFVASSFLIVLGITAAAPAHAQVTPPPTNVRVSQVNRGSVWGSFLLEWDPALRPGGAYSTYRLVNSCTYTTLQGEPAPPLGYDNYRWFTTPGPRYAIQVQCRCSNFPFPVRVSTGVDQQTPTSAWVNAAIPPDFVDSRGWLRLSCLR